MNQICLWLAFFFKKNQILLGSNFGLVDGIINIGSNL